MTIRCSSTTQCNCALLVERGDLLRSLLFSAVAYILVRGILPMLVNGCISLLAGHVTDSVHGPTRS